MQNLGVTKGDLTKFSREDQIRYILIRTNFISDILSAKNKNELNKTLRMQQNQMNGLVKEKTGYRLPTEAAASLSKPNFIAFQQVRTPIIKFLDMGSLAYGRELTLPGYKSHIAGPDAGGH